MGLKVITPPAAAITITDLRLHLRNEGLSADDSLILGYLAAAQEFAQHYTGISIGTQTLELALDAFPVGAIALPQGPATAVTTITHIDTAGALQTTSSALYALDDYSAQPSVKLTYGSAWPATRATPNAVKVRYVAGAATIPKAVISALLLMVGHLYENREEVAPADLKEIPVGAKALLDTVRVWSM